MMPRVRDAIHVEMVIDTIINDTSHQFPARPHQSGQDLCAQGTGNSIEQIML
jgi:hypothetical protein